MTVLATDTFSGTGQIDDGVNWDSIVDSVWAAGGGIAKVTAGNLSADWMLDYIGATWPADQYAQVTLVSPDAAGGLGEGYGPACRITSAGGGTYYRLVGNGSGWELSRFAGGSNAGSIASGSSPTFANGDVLRLATQNTTLRMYKNGAQFGGDQTNANIATGHAGISYSSTETSTAGVDNFEAGDLAGGGTVNTQTLSDTLTVGDASVMSQVRGRFHEDTISAVTDEGVLFYRRNRLLESSIAVTDEALASIVGNNILTKILSSNIDVTDGAVLSIIRKRILQDTILITEGSTEQYVNTNIVVDDTIDVTDSLLARLIWRRVLGDNLTITDEALATLVGQNVITKVLTSTLTTFDEALRWMNRFRLGESVVLTADEVVRVLSFARQLTDTIDAIDQAQTAMQRFILLSDALSVQDDVIASYIPPIGPATYDPIIRVGFDQPRIEIGGRALI